MAKRCRSKTGQFVKCSKKKAAKKPAKKAHAGKRCRDSRGHFTPCGPAPEKSTEVRLEEEWADAWAKGGWGAQKAAPAPEKSTEARLEEEWADAWEAHARKGMAARAASADSVGGRGRPIGNIQRKPGCFYYVDEKGVIREKNSYRQVCR